MRFAQAQEVIELQVREHKGILTRIPNVRGTRGAKGVDNFVGLSKKFTTERTENTEFFLWARKESLCSLCLP